MFLRSPRLPLARHEPPGVLPALTALNVVLTVLLWLTARPGPVSPALVALWLAGAFLLEVGSIPVPGFGRFSCVTAWTVGCLGALDTPPLVPALALSGWSALLVLRGWRRPAERAAALADQLLSLGWWPIYALLPFPGLARWLATAMLVFGAQSALYQWLAPAFLGGRPQSWRALERIVSPMRGLALCGALIAVCLPADQGSAHLLLLPLLFALHLGGQNLVEATADRQLGRETAETEERLRQTLSELDQARRQLQLGAKERALAEQLGERLARVSTPDELQAALQWALQGPLRLRSLTVFGAAEAPGVAEVRRDRVARVLKAPLVPEEPQALMLPLGSAVLYLGRSGPAWQSAEFEWLREVLRRVQPVHEHLQEAQGLRVRLRGQSCLAECGRLLARHLQLPDVWRETAEFLARVLPLQGLAVYAEDPRLAGLRQGPWPDALPEGSPGPYRQVLRLPLRAGRLALGFATELRLEPMDLELLQAMADLFDTSAERALLHEELVATHERLQASQDLWLQAHKSLAVAQLSAGVAHEINSPLGAIRLTLESLLPQAAPTQKERLENALESCQRAQDIIQRLAALSAREREQAASADLVQVARQLLDQLRPQLERAGMEAALEAPAHLVCPFSGELLANLVVPLLLNAIESGARALVVRLAPGSCEVIDNGPGIPPEIQSRLREPFFTTKKIGKNVGLGLSLVDQACQQTGARLSLESAPGRTAFRLSWAH